MDKKKRMSSKVEEKCCSSTLSDSGECVEISVFTLFKERAALYTKSGGGLRPASPPRPLIRSNMVFLPTTTVGLFAEKSSA